MYCCIVLVIMCISMSLLNKRNIFMFKLSLFVHVIKSYVVACCSLECLTYLTFLDPLLVQGRPLFESSSISDIVPCLQSVGISSSLRLGGPSISFSADLYSFSPKLPGLAISHRCGSVLVSSSGHTTLVFCFPEKLQHVLRAPPS